MEKKENQTPYLGLWFRLKLVLELELDLDLGLTFWFEALGSYRPGTGQLNANKQCEHLNDSPVKFSFCFLSMTKNFSFTCLKRLDTFLHKFFKVTLSTCQDYFHRSEVQDLIFFQIRTFTNMTHEGINNRRFFSLQNFAVIVHGLDDFNSIFNQAICFAWQIHSRVVEPLTSSGKSLGWGDVKRILMSGSMRDTLSSKWEKRRPPGRVR